MEIEKISLASKANQIKELTWTANLLSKFIDMIANPLLAMLICIAIKGHKHMTANQFAKLSGFLSP